VRVFPHRASSRNGEHSAKHSRAELGAGAVWPIATLLARADEVIE
jgi:hypothetical protein